MPSPLLHDSTSNNPRSRTLAAVANPEEIRELFVESDRANASNLRNRIVGKFIEMTEGRSLEEHYADDLAHAREVDASIQRILKGTS